MTSSLRTKSHMLIALALAILCVACATAPSATPAPDYAVLETQVAVALQKTMTALAPTRTHTASATPIPPTATPTATASATATPSPTPETPEGPAVACVRPVQDLGPNVVLRDLEQGTDLILTHLQDPGPINDVTWSPDGEWVLFCSGHDFLSSRTYGHNIFRVRPDGTELAMITGDYVDPETAPGPYTTVSGRIVDAPGACQVYAQGATGPVMSDETGAFELTGVPAASTWVRAIYQGAGHIEEGMGDLVLTQDTFEPITLTLSAGGRGWRQADLHPDGRLLAGTTYTWTIQADQEINTRYAGTVYDLETQQVSFEIENVNDAALDGVAWAPNGKELTGALTGETAAYLWRWDDQGRSLGSLVEIPRPDDDLISIAHPAWSPDGSMIAFELRHQYWWSDPATFKTDILIASADGQGVTSLTNSDWGEDAREPSWSSDGKMVYYLWATGEPDQPYAQRNGSDLWSIRVSDAMTAQWTSDGQTAAPSCRVRPE